MEVQKPWIPDYLPLFYFIILFSREGYFFFQRVFIAVHQIFISFFSLGKLKQGWDKAA
jgi:hypothetical protein